MRSECARSKTTATARCGPLNASSTRTTHGAFNVPSTLCSPPTSLSHRTLCPKPTPISITYNAFLAYTPSTKTLSAAPSPPVLHLDQTLSPPEYLSSSLQSRKCKVVRPSRARTPVNLQECSVIQLKVYKPVAAGRRRSGTLLAVPIRQRILTPCSTSPLSSIYASAFPSTPPRRCSSCSVAKTPFASLLTHQSGIQAECRKQHEQRRMRWAMGAMIRCPRALPAPRARVLAIEPSFPCPRPYPWL
ncbi:hypothetical protein B0H13DRAFT_2668206 [Mycena leptocephala]|nr:hypothetical protein B0H13DRAFT_2668206 [Mycena leptocephala]